MLKQDFIERLIEELGATLGRALGKRAEDNHAAALRSLRLAYDDVFGLDADLLAALDPSMLFSLLRDDAEAPLVARLMRHEAEQLLIMEDPGARRVARRALEILAAYARSHRLSDAALADLRALQTHFGFTDLPAATADALAQLLSDGYEPT